MSDLSQYKIQHITTNHINFIKLCHFLLTLVPTSEGNHFLPIQYMQTDNIYNLCLPGYHLNHLHDVVNLNKELPDLSQWTHIVD